MGLLNMFRPADSVSADKVREVVESKSPNEYCLLDVRQPREYEQGHLPGARLIPLAELRAALGELDAHKETYVYCRSGNRSLSATALLADAGLSDVHNMSGGIDAWNGHQASGPPEFGKFCFPSTLTPAELVAVAWMIEDGTQRFYRGVFEACKSICKVIEKLAQDGDTHKRSLENLFEKLSGEAPAEGFPRSALEPHLEVEEDMMAGCVPLDKALAWASGREVYQVLELMMAFKANALDLYIKMARGVDDEGAKEVFTTLAEQEQKHLEALGRELSALE